MSGRRCLSCDERVPVADAEAFGGGFLCPTCVPGGEESPDSDGGEGESDLSDPQGSDSERGNSHTAEAECNDDEPPERELPPIELPDHSDGAPTADPSGRVFFPGGLKPREWWVNWVLAVRWDEMDGDEPAEDAKPTKQPVAPYKNGNARPTTWHFGLDEDEHPSTTFDEVREWDGLAIGRDIHAPDRVLSDRVGTGIIIPTDQDEREITLLDWDDVRDPKTGEIHPVCAWALAEAGGYAEISQSGEGIHQFLYGTIPGGFAKFLRHIDGEPFVGDDLPMVEMYRSGRLTAMTGEHVAGTGEDVVEGQGVIDRLCWEFGRGTNNAEGSPTDPFAGDRDTKTDQEAAATAPSHAEVGESLRESIAYEGDDPAEWDIPDGESVEYHAVLRARDHSDELSNTANWELIGYAAAFGKRYGLDKADVLADLEDHPTPQYGYDESRARKEVRGVYRKMENGNYHPPSRDTLVRRGILPETYATDGDEDNGEEYRPDPRTVDIVLDPGRAWDAAGRVEPADLPDDATLPRTDDGGAFACPGCGDSVDVVRAVALAHDLVNECDADLDDQYAEAYRLAREEHDAPLPRYLTTTDAVAEFDAVLGAIAELDFFHLDTDAMATTVTATDDEVGGEAVRALDPAWRESESGESVLVFSRGTVWDADTETVVDTLRFVALDAGLLDDPGDQLQGEVFTTAYRLAREEYGAPLPRWNAERRAVTPMLPPAEKLVDTPDTVAVDRDKLEETWEDVEDLISRVTQDVGRPSVVTAPPATGKTTATIKNALEQPTTYLAPRKELQAQALRKAEQWDVSAEVLPVFTRKQIDEGTLADAVAHVREHGKDRLRDRWAIVDAVGGEGAVFAEDDEDGADIDELERPTCGTADGEHGEAWALVVHVARKLGYTPRDIHQRAPALFGTVIPCEHDGEGCPYKRGWEAVADPEDPPDLLVGSYVHAHVESARTYYQEAGGGEIERSERAVVFDEYPGEAFSTEFGEEAEEHAAWLARALREDVRDVRDLYQSDLWADEWVRAWLSGTATDAVDGVGEAVDALERRADLVDAHAAAEEIVTEVDHEILDSLDLLDILEDVVDGAAPRDVVGMLETKLDAVRPEHGAFGIVNWVRDAVLRPLAAAYGDRSVDVDALPGGGELQSLLERAVVASDAREDGAVGLCRAAADALRGGEQGTRELAVWADDGYAHPDAHHLLHAAVAPAGDGESIVIETDRFAFDPDATDGTRLDHVKTSERATTLFDRNGHGAVIHDPPSRESGGGDEVPVVGLDATGREELWSLVLGETVTTEDIHDGSVERARFLRDVLGLQVVRCSDQARPYEGDPESKDTDGDAALLERIAEEHTGIKAPRERGSGPEVIGPPAVVTTKGVRSVLEHDDRLDGIVSEWENYGNLTGANDLGDHRLAALLGSQHYGDHAVERLAALAGEEVDTSRADGRGMALDYGSPVANAYLEHMREDQVMQAALRFARGDSGAIVFARTAALRDDLPVVGEGQVVETYSEAATKIARAWHQVGEEFTAADVADAVDVSRRHVNRVLVEFVDAGYLSREAGEPGEAHTYTPEDQPGSGEVELPHSVRPDGREPRQDAHSIFYTWNVRVSSLGDGGDRPSTTGRGELPAPGTAPVRATAVDPPPE